MEESGASSERTSSWSIAQVAGYSLLVTAAFFATQIVAMVGLLLVQLANDSELDMDQWVAGVESDGLLLSIATISSAVACVPFIKFLSGRREPDTWAFLRLKRVEPRTILLWLSMLVGFVIVSDSLNFAIGRPVVPEYMVEVYVSAPPLLLFVALVFAAPLFEEIFFRGLMLGGLESAGVSTTFAAVTASLAWTAIHTQYEPIDLGTIFLMGLLFAAARSKTGSLIPCLAMHSLANVIAFSEVLFVARSAGV